MEKIILPIETADKDPKNLLWAKLYVKPLTIAGSPNIGVTSLQTTETAIYDFEIFDILKRVLCANNVWADDEIVLIEDVKKAWHDVLNNQDEVLKRVDFKGAYAEKVRQYQSYRNKFQDLAYGNMFFSYNSVDWDNPMTQDEATIRINEFRSASVGVVKDDKIEEMKALKPTKKTKTV